MGHLRCGPIPGVNEDGKVGLGGPFRVLFVHRLDPVLGSLGGQVPPDDDPSVAPLFVLHHLQEETNEISCTQ